MPGKAYRSASLGQIGVLRWRQFDLISPWIVMRHGLESILVGSLVASPMFCWAGSPDYQEQRIPENLQSSRSLEIIHRS
jgi:hypothetical protein